MSAATAVSLARVIDSPQALNEKLRTEQQSPLSLQQQIEVRAYALWERRGCPENSADIDWLEAEREIVAGGRR